MSKLAEKYPQYYKVCKYRVLDVYRVLVLFGVKDHAVAHATKKLLATGIRGAKNERQDILEAIEALERRLEMMDEDEVEQLPMPAPQVPPPSSVQRPPPFYVPEAPPPSPRAPAFPPDVLGTD